MSENNKQNNENIKTPETKKEDKIPNSLIIYVKTRIPNFYKINYEPYMSVPKNKSHTVYFDPLVKYYEGPIKNLPLGSPKDALITQFFEASEFDSMINRILSDFRYMQKPRTFKQSYDDHIIENNLHITLKNLFKNNSLFYIDKKPYTIVGVKSNPSNWQIDKKPLEKLLGQFSHLSVKEIQQEADKEEDDIPEILRQGNVASSNITEEEKATVVASGLKTAAETQDNENLNKEVSGITDSFVTQDELPGVSKDILNLYTKYLRQNNPINYSNNADLARDPLTLSLLVDPTDLLNFINTNKKTALVDLYSAFISAKINLNQADKSYIDSCVELAKYKTTFDTRIKSIVDFIRRKINKLTIDEQKQRTTDLMIEITQLKVGYMQIIFKIADSINEIYQLQQVYFVATKSLLKGLKDDYANIIQYYEKPELALKCIDNDIVTVSLLIEKDPENPYSVSYYTNYNNFQEFYENQLYKNKQQLLEPQINFVDEAEIYINQPGTLLVEKEQYEIYNFKMFLSYSYNQFDIWIVLFKSIELFIRFISKETSDIISLSEKAKNFLNDNFTNEQQDTILKSINYQGIKTSLNPESNELNWYFVNNNGTKAIKTVKNRPEKTFDELFIEHINTNMSLEELYKKYEKTDEELSEEAFQELFQELYINYIKTSVKAYDAIILYIYLIEILCLRQNRVYVAEENVNQLNFEYSLTLDIYYNTIIKNIKNLQPDTTIHIPLSMLWDITNLNNIAFLENKKRINTRSNVIYRSRLKSIAESRNNLVSSCEEISKIITPNISKTGFIKQCNNIVSMQSSSITPHTFRSTYWMSQSIKNYDIQSTNDFIYNMNKTVKDAWHDRIIDDIDVKDYLDWTVFDNDAGVDDTDSLYAAVADGLNRQLDITNNETTNPYTETIDGRQMFTTNTIKQLYMDNKPPSFIDNDINSIRILERILKIKFIIFEMFPHKLPISIGDMVLYKGRPHRVLSITTTGTPWDESNKKLYNLYNGYTEIKDVPQKKLKKDPNNLLQDFRILCDYDANNQDIQFNDYMYIALTTHVNDDDENSKKFKLVYNTSITYIFTEDKIPIYIKYLIFNSCPNLDNEKLTKMGLGNPELLREILQFETKRRERIARENIRDDIHNIEVKIKEYKEQYKILEKITDKTLEQQAEQVLYKEEIKDLKQRKNILKDLLRQEDDRVNAAPVDAQNILGGATTLIPGEQYESYAPQYSTVGYPMNPSNPSNQNNIIYLPRQLYPYQNYYTNNQYRVPYNISQNKEKDQKSKLSFYITIELELFPGTSVNNFQKSVVKCQSTFERIRESWADIFGFEYRPSPMSETYSYMFDQKDDKKVKTEKKRTTGKNTTRKLKSSK